MLILYSCLIFLDYPYVLQFLACLKILSEVLQTFWYVKGFSDQDKLGNTVLGKHMVLNMESFV